MLLWRSNADRGKIDELKKEMTADYGHAHLTEEANLNLETQQNRQIFVRKAQEKKSQQSGQIG